MLHSPYYIDSDSKKIREIDVKGRGFFSSKEFKYHCDVDFIVECKSLKNYHIIANNRAGYYDTTSFDFIWLGNYADIERKELEILLFKFNYTFDEVKNIKQKLEQYCFPQHMYRYRDLILKPYDIPTFNTFRETNTTNDKNIDNSVIWKCFQSIQSCTNAHEDLLFKNIEYQLTEIEHDNYNNRQEKIDYLVETLISMSNHVYFIHPIIIVESNLYELNESHELNEIKYFRLRMQKLFENELWVDIVNFKYLDDYFNNTTEYFDFFENNNFNKYTNEIIKLPRH